MKELTETREELIEIARRNVSPDIFWEAIGPDAIDGVGWTQEYLAIYNDIAEQGIEAVNNRDALALGMLLLPNAHKYIQQAAEDVVEGWPR